MTAIEHFSGFEVIRAAMEVEKNGHRFYSAVAERAHNPIAREIFTWLAQDEVGHLKTLENLVPLYQEGAFWEDEEAFLPYLRHFSEKEIFPSAERLNSLLQSETFDLRALDLAIEAEERFAEYFRKATENARTADGKKAFAWLAEEEERHASQLRARRERIQQQNI
jgi:rubrerythrin